MVSAAPQDQWRLLDVQEHDTRLAQLEHRRQSLPELARIATAEAQERTLLDDVVRARTEVDDLRRQLTKAEADVEQVRSRLARDQARLDSGQGSAKDLQGIQHEIGTLQQRQSVLEDAELEVMERHEAAEVALAAADGELRGVQEQLAALRERVQQQLAQVDDEVGNERRARDDAAAGVPRALIELYEKVRARTGGVGAAKLFQRRCEGCRLELPPQDLARIRSAGPDEVIRCEECGRILVRTADSGL